VERTGGKPPARAKPESGLHEEEEQGNNEAENAKTFGERCTDEGAAELAISCRWVAQGARKEVAENRADANGGKAHANSGKASTNIGSEGLGGGQIHDYLLMERFVGWMGSKALLSGLDAASR
jgi:hypothetical protein